MEKEFNKQADRFLDKLRDRKFALLFAAKPAEAMKEARLDFSIQDLINELSRDKDTYKKFLDKLADNVDVFILRDVLAASTCADRPTTGIQKKR